MKTVTCQHCSANIKVDAATLKELRKTPRFQCPNCSGFLPSSLLNPASLPMVGANRNLLILGGVTLLVLGGIGFFLASQKSGDTNTVNQNIRNKIINNAYFQNLIATGVTTKEDLEAIADIRTYRDGFIGISTDAINSEQAQQAAKRMGAQILAVDQVADTSSQQMIAWLRENLVSETSSTVWVIQNQALGILVGEEILAAKGSESERKALFHWHGSAADQKKSSEPVDLIALVDLDKDKEGGEWRKIPEGLILESGQGVCRMHVPYVPPAEYDYVLEFSLVRDWIGAVYKGCVKDGQQVGWTVQGIHGEDVHSMLRIDNVHGSSYPGTKVPQTMLKNNVRYRSLVEVRGDEVRAYLDGQLLARWSGSFRAGPSINPEKPLSFGAWDPGIIFHKAEIIPYDGSGETSAEAPQSGNSPGTNIVPLPGVVIRKTEGYARLTQKPVTMRKGTYLFSCLLPDDIIFGQSDHVPELWWNIPTTTREVEYKRQPKGWIKYSCLMDLETSGTYEFVVAIWSFDSVRMAGLSLKDNETGEELLTNGAMQDGIRHWATNGGTIEWVQEMRPNR